MHRACAVLCDGSAQKSASAWLHSCRPPDATMLSGLLSKGFAAARGGGSWLALPASAARADMAVAPYAQQAAACPGA